jgi:multimeric flavodoxin WrbA
MKAIALNGSPRPGGNTEINTEIMLKKVLEPLAADCINTCCKTLNVSQPQKRERR